MIGTFKFPRRMASYRTGIALALALTLASSVKATPINFNPTGGATVGGVNPGTIQNVIGFDLGAGDAIAKASITGGGLVVGSSFQLYYQTTITGFNLADGTKSTPIGLNSAYQLTEISTFNETVTSIGSNGTALFALTPGTPNQTSIYFTDLSGGATKANATNGNGFSSGTLIMTLTTTTDQSNYTDTTKNLTSTPPGTDTLNKSGSGGFSGVTTDQGTGSVNLGLGVNGYNSSFFQTAGIVSSLFSSNIKLPFTEIAPSTGFNDPFAPGSPTIGVNVGSNNGTSGPDFLLQISGASQSFNVVPEPASVAMTVLGLGTFMFGSFVARRRRANA